MKFENVPAKIELKFLKSKFDKFVEVWLVYEVSIGEQSQTRRELKSTFRYKNGDTVELNGSKIQVTVNE